MKRLLVFLTALTLPAGLGGTSPALAGPPLVFCEHDAASTCTTDLQGSSRLRLVYSHLELSTGAGGTALGRGVSNAFADWIRIRVAKPAEIRSSGWVEVRIHVDKATIARSGGLPPEIASAINRPSDDPSANPDIDGTQSGAQIDVQAFDGSGTGLLGSAAPARILDLARGRTNSSGKDVLMRFRISGATRTISVNVLLSMWNALAWNQTGETGTIEQTVRAYVTSVRIIR